MAQSGEEIFLMFNTSLLFVVGLYLSPVSAWAGVQFIWKADGTVEVGAARSFVAGSAREGTITEMDAKSGTKIWVLPFSNAFVAVGWVESGKDHGYVVILERENSRYYAITKEIRGPAENLMPGLQEAVKNLEKTRRWDASIALRAFSAHFADRPTDTLTEFYAAIQQGKVTTLPRPDRKGTRVQIAKPSRQSPPAAASETQAPRQAADAVTSQPKRRRPANPPPPPSNFFGFSGGFLRP
jgi:hypothetical protein